MVLGSVLLLVRLVSGVTQGWSCSDGHSALTYLVSQGPVAVPMSTMSSFAPSKWTAPAGTHKNEPVGYAFVSSCANEVSVAKPKFALGNVQVSVGDVTVRGIENSRGDEERVREHHPGFARPDESRGFRAVLVRRLPGDVVNSEGLRFECMRHVTDDTGFLFAKLANMRYGAGIEELPDFRSKHPR